MQKFGVAAFVLLSSFIYGCGSQNYNHNSEVDSVAIPQTPVDNQGRMGFCWLYAETGLIESNYKTITGNTVNLSEEALAVFRFAHAIHKMFKTVPAAKLLRSLSSSNIPQGWFMRFSEATYMPDYSEEDDMDGLELTKRYGVWPEAIWSVKAPTPEARDKMMRGISQRAMKFIAKFDRYTATVDDIINQIIVGPDGFVSRPPAAFRYAGKMFTPQEFLQFLKFNPDNFVSITSRSVYDYGKIVSATKRALTRGLSVPLGFPINISRLQGDTFSGKNVPSETVGDLVNFTRDGGHLVLVTDFVNEGGQQGRTSQTQLRLELQRGSEFLDYLYFKNSWGVGAKSNESGFPVGESISGYYKIDREYLQAASKVGAHAGWTPLEVIVPSDIASAPWGFEPISEKVSLPGTLMN
jgi:hypothetical protein